MPDKWKGLTVSAVGDIMLGDSPYCLGYGVGSMIAREGPTFPFSQIAPVLRDADVTFGNLEVVLSRFDPHNDPFPQIEYRGQPEAVSGLVESGFDILAVASNHTMEHGAAAFEENLDVLRAAGIVCVGADLPAHETGLTAVVERGGVRFGFAAFNLRPTQYFLAAPPWPTTPTTDGILAAIDELRTAADVVVLSLHWGDEFIAVPSPMQVALAHTVVDHGADIILGHHPHIVQGIERYKGAVIAYSLGNFVFDMWQQRLRRSLVLTLEITSRRDIRHQVVPIEINTAHQPVPLKGPAAAAWIAEVERRKEAIGTVSAEDYARELDARFREFRREVLRHYIRNLFRYPPGRLAENFLGALKKRIRIAASASSARVRPETRKCM